MEKPVGGGLSGEHIQLCAEGARSEKAESLRQMDRDARCLDFRGAVLVWAAFCFFIEMERGNCYAE